MRDAPRLTSGTLRAVPGWLVTAGLPRLCPAASRCPSRDLCAQRAPRPARPALRGPVLPGPPRRPLCSAVRSLLAGSLAGSRAGGRCAAGLRVREKERTLRCVPTGFFGKESVSPSPQFVAKVSFSFRREQHGGSYTSSARVTAVFLMTGPQVPSPREGTPAPWGVHVLTM